MEKIRLTFECPCGAFDVFYADKDDWDQGAVIIECPQCKRALHQLDGTFMEQSNDRT